MCLTQLKRSFPFILLSRFLKQHMLLLGIFYSKEKPPMNVYLRPIIDDINKVYKQGEWM